MRGESSNRPAIAMRMSNPLLLKDWKEEIDRPIIRRPARYLPIRNMTRPQCKELIDFADLTWHHLLLTRRGDFDWLRPNTDRPSTATIAPSQRVKITAPRYHSRLPVLVLWQKTLGHRGSASEDSENTEQTAFAPFYDTNAQRQRRTPDLRLTSRRGEFDCLRPNLHRPSASTIEPSHRVKTTSPSHYLLRPVSQNVTYDILYLNSQILSEECHRTTTS